MNDQDDAGLDELDRSDRAAFLYYTPKSAGGGGLIRRFERYRSVSISIDHDAWGRVIAFAERYGTSCSFLCAAVCAMMLRDIGEAGLGSPRVRGAIESAMARRLTESLVNPSAFRSDHTFSMPSDMRSAIAVFAKENGAALGHFVAEYIAVTVKELAKDLSLADRILAPFILGRPGPLADVRRAIVETVRVLPGDVVIVRERDGGKGDKTYGRQQTRLFVEEAKRAFPHNAVLYVPRFMELKIVSRGEDAT